MKLIVGLGNPGLEYDGTRHNVGFVVIERLARRYSTGGGHCTGGGQASPAGGTAKARFHGLLLEACIDGERTLLLRPTTFMNLSGQSVIEALGFYKLSAADDLLVIADDLALPCGTIRIRTEGGAGGHNGLQDICSRLGSESWARCRIGIDSPGTMNQSAYVLGRFRPDQQEAVESAIEQAVAAAVCFTTKGAQCAMNSFNRKNESTIPNAEKQR